MSTITKQHNPPAPGAHRHHKKILRIALIGGVVLVIVLAGFLAWQWWPRDTTKPTDAATLAGQRTEKEQENDRIALNEELIDRNPDDIVTDEDKASLLFIKIDSALEIKKYEQALSFSKDLLAINGHEIDTYALLSIANAYHGLGKKNEEKQALTRLKNVYDTHPELMDEGTYTAINERIAK